MAKRDKPNNSKSGEPPAKKVSPEDLDKTVIDVDIRQLKEGFDETVIVRAPMAEDSDLHNMEFFDEERTGDHVVDELAEAAKLGEEPTEPVAKQRKEAKAPQPPKPPEKKKKESPKEARQAEPIIAEGGEEQGAPELEAEAPPAAVAKPKLSPLSLILGLVFLLLLAEGLVEVLRQGASLRLPAILAVGFSVLCLAGALLRRLEGWTACFGTIFAWFGLVALAGVRFYTSDPDSLHFFKMPLETWVGPSFAVVALVIALALFGTKRLNFLPKLLGGLACLLVLIAAGLALAERLPLEGALWGPAYLSKLPSFLRPGLLALGYAFPLATLALLLAWLFRPKGQTSFLRAGGWALLGLALSGSYLGLKLLSRQGVEIPLLSRLVRQDFFGATVLDPLTSPIRVQVSNGRPGFGRKDWMHLTLAASNSRAQGKGRQAWLMVKNQEGRSFAAVNEASLAFSRGEKNLKGVKAELERARLGKDRQLALLVQLPSLVETQVKSALTAAILDLASQLRGRDRLHLISPAGSETLEPDDEGAWAKKVAKLLAPGEPSADAAGQAFKKLSGGKGLKQLILVTDAAKLPPPEQCESLAGEAKKQQVGFSVLALGTVENPSPELYAAPSPASLGFELFSAAAESLGDVSVSFPQLAPLPKVKWARSTDGKAALQAGKLAFEITAEDPGAIQSLQLKVDEEKPVDLEKSSLSQAVDLGALKVKPGPHRLALVLTTVEGDVVSDIVETQYSAKKPLRFVKPLDKDTIAGNFNVMVSVGRAQGAEPQSVDLLVDGNKIGQSTSPPFQIPLNTTALSEGEHTLQAVETYTDGTTESVQVQVNVNQQVPQVQILRPGIGEYLPNLAEIEAQVGGGLFEQVQKIEFLVDGEWIGESPQAPFRLLWSNSAFPAGSYFIQARAYLNSQATTTDAVQIQLGQGEIVVEADPSVSATGTLFPDNVEILIDASVGMKEPVGASLKLDLAKSSMSGLLATLPENVRLNARVLGAGSMAAQNNCEDVRLLKNPAGELDQVRAQGLLPLARALELLEKDLKKTQGSRVGLLVADTWDSCGGDPIAVATRLAKNAERLRLHVIYFSDVDPTTESLLKRLAEVMGGRTYRVSRQEDLQQAIRDAVQVSFSLFDYKNTPVLEMPLSQTPFAVRAGEYRLEVDTSPPLVKNGVVIPTGGRKTFTVLSQGGKYELKEE
ncbi:MAG: Ig-like domain-containing protein [bacterium]